MSKTKHVLLNSYYSMKRKSERLKFVFDKKKLTLKVIFCHFLTTQHYVYWQNTIIFFEYRKVASSNTSRFEAHAGLFKLLMKGIFDAYVLWPFDQKCVFEFLRRVNTRDFTLIEIAHRKAYMQWLCPGPMHCHDKKWCSAYLPLLLSTRK